MPLHRPGRQAGRPGRAVWQPIIIITIRRSLDSSQGSRTSSRCKPRISTKCRQLRCKASQQIIGEYHISGRSIEVTLPSIVSSSLTRTEHDRSCTVRLEAPRTLHVVMYIIYVYIKAKLTEAASGVRQLDLWSVPNIYIYIYIYMCARHVVIDNTP